MNLYLFRGLPGSGKTTIAQTLCENVFSADDYFINSNGVYKFDPSQSTNAHNDCEIKTKKALEAGKSVAVANTFTQEWEMQNYFDLAEKYGATVFCFIVENRHGNKSIHDVPSETVEAMKDRFEISL